MIEQSRIRRELRNFWEDQSVVGISLSQDRNDICHLTAVIAGPVSTPYEGGIFDVDIYLPDNYPFEPPTISFITKIWHPNIDRRNGVVSTSPLKGDWTSTMNLTTALISLQSLLSEPELSEAQNAVVATQYLRNRQTFIHKASEWTHIYANNLAPPPNPANRTRSRRITRLPRRLNDYML